MGAERPAIPCVSHNSSSPTQIGELLMDLTLSQLAVPTQLIGLAS